MECVCEDPECYSVRIGIDSGLSQYTNVKRRRADGREMSVVLGHDDATYTHISIMSTTAMLPPPFLIAFGTPPSSQ